MWWNVKLWRQNIGLISHSSKCRASCYYLSYRGQSLQGHIIQWQVYTYSEILKFNWLTVLDELQPHSTTGKQCQSRQSKLSEFHTVYLMLHVPWSGPIPIQIINRVLMHELVWSGEAQISIAEAARIQTEILLFDRQDRTTCHAWRCNVLMTEDTGCMKSNCLPGLEIGVLLYLLSVLIMNEDLGVRRDISFVAC